MFFEFPKLIERYDEKNKSTLKDLQIFEWSSAAIFNEMRFYKYFPGRIIFLLGTSSAGKSSIAKYIKDNSITDPNLIKFTGTDVIYYDLFIDCFYKNLPKETEFLFNKIRDVSKIVGYINEPEKFTLDNLEYLHLRSNVYIRIKTILEKFHDMRDELSSSVEMKYQYYCAKAIIMPLLQGKTVIIDTIELGSYFQALGHHLIKCKTDTIIVYCSPQNLEKHIVDRNKINIEATSDHDIRFFFPFEQYDEIYIPTMGSLEAADQITLFNIQKIDANAQVACLKPYILTLQTQDQDHSSKKKIWQHLLSEIESIIAESETIQNISRKQSLIDKWFPTKTNAIYIKPRVMYQMFLNSGITSTVECGKKVLEVIDENDSNKAKNSNANRLRLSV